MEYAEYNAAVIEDGVVTNVIVVNSLSFMPNLVLIPEGVSAGIGWGYDGTDFTPPVSE